MKKDVQNLDAIDLQFGVDCACLVMKKKTNLQITINGIEINSVESLNEVEMHGNDNAVKLHDLVLHLLKYNFKSIVTINITTFNPDVSIEVKDADKESNMLIKQIVEQHLGFVLFVQH